MTEMPKTGGKRRIDQVLGPGYADELGSLETDEVRRRRDLTRLEREYLSFVRRLLQGRRDILRDELRRRRSGGEPIPIVERLVAVLSEGSRGPSRGEAPVIPLPEEEVMMARRRVERLVSDSRLSNLEALSDEEIEDVVGRIEEEERTVSDARAKVIDVHDALQDEMKRRLRAELGRLSP
ncbi:MAG TPA: aerial mycelium formation protein [Actinomycetota bacterium]|nr:aerial mycelium formation protein [Actinomycetota bacterium]